MRLIQIGIIALILLIALAIDRLQRQLTRALGQLVPALSNWARGDFSAEVRIATRIREIDDIETSLNQLRTYLLELVGTLRKQATRVAESSRSLDEMSSSLHDGAQRQTGDTAQIRDSLGELEATIQQVADGAGEAAQASRAARACRAARPAGHRREPDRPAWAGQRGAGATLWQSNDWPTKPSPLARS